MNKKLLFTLTLSALLFTSCGQSGSKQDATIDKLNAAKPGSSEFESASKEMTELSEELQATSEKCQKLAPNFTKEQKQRFLKAAMKFASASKKIKIDV